MANALSDISTEQLQRALEIKQQIESLQDELNSIFGGASVGVKRGPGRPKLGRPPGSGRKTMSPAARKAIGAAQKARWAKQKGEAAPAAEEKPARKGKRKMSAAGRAAIAAAARKRWAEAKKQGKNKL